MSKALENKITYGVMKNADKKSLIWFNSYEKALKFGMMLNCPNTIIRRTISYKDEVITGFYVERENNEDEN